MRTKLVMLLIVACLAATLLIRPAFAKILGDIDGDGDVDIHDVVLATSQYSLSPGSKGYNATIVEKVDLAPPYDGIINIYDLLTLISHYTGSR